MWFKGIKLHLLERLGEGQQGCVFKALRRDARSELAQTVAVKILHSETAVELWQREFESLQRVRSPYCVQVLSFERVQGRPALILEYIDGVTLSDLISRHPLEPQIIDEILAQLEEALRDLEAAKLFHGDLSPHNILIDVTGRIRLLDFGLANCGSRMTPEFAAPERLQGAMADFSSDLFSLGRIEQYLKGQDLSLCTPNNFLHFHPALRSPRGLISTFEHRKILATLVEKQQEFHRRSKRFPTRSMISEVAAISPLVAPHVKRWAIASLMALFIALNSSAALNHSEAETAVLAVRTEKWHHLSLNGREIGYAPIELTVPANATFELTWVSRAGRGSKRIKIDPGALKVLGDRDFSH